MYYTRNLSLSIPQFHQKLLCCTFAVSIKLVNLHVESYLIFAVIGYTSLARRHEQRRDSLLYPVHIMH